MRLPQQDVIRLYRSISLESVESYIACRVLPEMFALLEFSRRTSTKGSCGKLHDWRLLTRSRPLRRFPVCSTGLALLRGRDTSNKVSGFSNNLFTFHQGKCGLYGYYGWSTRLVQA